jgi:protein gp37
MAKNSSIEWTHHTFNPWWGCAKVSPACAHCYAEAWAKRVGQNVWGGSADRRFFGDKHWAEPLKWDEEAEAIGARHRVFCASMADVFEPRADLDPEREKLWALIQATPSLDWLLLTKRPGSVSRLAPWRSDWPHNVWLGTTVENQLWADRRLPLLLQHAARRRFLSCEPLLGPIDLSKWTKNRAADLHPIDWIIAGGESGPGARPMLPGWARQLRDQCGSADISFHFKQWGHWAPAESVSAVGVEKFWDDVEGRDVTMRANGKKVNGRSLDGQTWDQLPVAA